MCSEGLSRWQPAIRRCHQLPDSCRPSCAGPMLPGRRATCPRPWGLQGSRGAETQEPLEKAECSEKGGAVWPWWSGDSFEKVTNEQRGLGSCRWRRCVVFPMRQCLTLALGQ